MDLTKRKFPSFSLDLTPYIDLDTGAGSVWNPSALRIYSLCSSFSYGHYEYALSETSFKYRTGLFKARLS